MASYSTKLVLASSTCRINVLNNGLKAGHLTGHPFICYNHFMKLIFLCGPPAIGKTTVGRELAEFTHYRFFCNRKNATKPASSLRRMIWAAIVLCLLLGWGQHAAASPFGEGVFGAHVPFGSATSLSIALGGNVSLSLSPSGANFSGTGSHTITVTSTDVVGYNLYVYSPGGTNMTNGTSTIPTSANVTAAPLAVDTWGYNTDGSSNFKGMTTTPALLKSASGPFESGDNTTVTYGVLTSLATGEGGYNASVVYTAVAANE